VAEEVEFLFQIPDPSRPAPLVSVYLQFVDERGSESVVYSATARLEVFPLQTDAFKIEDGADVTAERLVWLDIEVPENARTMRVFEETKTPVLVVALVEIWRKSISVEVWWQLLAGTGNLGNRPVPLFLHF